MSAVISECGLYRYRLERETVGDGQTTVIMVNPSTADATQDDATIRKLLGFGHRYQWGRVVVGNLFAYRATDVRELSMVDDPVGPLNDVYLDEMIRLGDRCVFAWGRASKLPARLRHQYKHVDSLARSWLRMPMSIGAPAMDGHPCHPLMLPYSRTLQPWTKP